MSGVEVTGLVASYDATPVLHGVDLALDDASITAVLGPSGSGKSTLLRVLAGLHRPSAGSVRIGERLVDDSGATFVPPERRGIGLVPQSGALFPHLDVARNIAFGLRGPRRRTSGARVGELVELTGLHGLERRMPHQLSGGQRQRVALARALAQRPSLVLLDEPFSSLDAGLREETGRAVVHALRAAGAAAVLVTHDQGEALSLADQVAVMAEGRFLQVAAPASVYLSPADPRVAAFIGHASMLPGTVTSDGRGLCALGSVEVRSATTLSGAVQFAVRSEQLQVRPESGEGTPGDVLDVSFFGHDATIRVRLASGEHVAARTPSDAVPRPGDRVRVAVLGEVVAFPA